MLEYLPQNGLALAHSLSARFHVLQIISTGHNLPNTTYCKELFYCTVTTKKPIIKYNHTAATGLCPFVVLALHDYIQDLSPTGQAFQPSATSFLITSLSGAC